VSCPPPPAKKRVMDCWPLAGALSLGAMARR
jgi:hypothetical protein